MQERKGRKGVYVGLPAVSQVQYYLVQSCQHPLEVGGVLFYWADVGNASQKS